MVKLAKGNVIAKEKPKNISYKEEVEQKLATFFSKYPDPPALFINGYFTSLVTDGSADSHETNCYSWMMWEILNDYKIKESYGVDYDFDENQSLCKAIKALLKGLIENYDKDCIPFFLDLLEIFESTRVKKGGVE
ncbi:MAG: hypothetical protein J7604_03605 [Sporocytophaga sp.]|uniref:hypothetical protein n=1 Tax=Sporocytophaga sp. TaxID=2231183 RepID=UPI001B1B0240|nr:hypothetical protein [Sporocytophaga sp.]MBO9699267.1 hypothetical protein [Sporocytophaga sp.]